MNGRAKRTFRALAATALALALALTTLSPVRAEDPPAPDKSIGSSENPAQAAITKILKVPEGTEIPDVTYTFTAKKISFDGVDDDASKAKMPDTLVASDMKVSFSSATSDTDNTAHITTVIGESGNIVEGVTFQHVGVYAYEIRETAIEDVDEFYDNDDENVTLYTHESEAVYRVEIHVGKEAETLFVAYIVAKRIYKDDGEDGEQEKVDPTPGGGDGDYSDMTFTNEYAKSIGGGDSDPEDISALFISKEVTGRGNKDLYFPFSVKITDPDLADTEFPTVYRAYVLSENQDDETVVVDDETNIGTASDSNSYGKYYEFTPGTAKTINLKHGQRLSFVNTPVGASWIAIEKLTGNTSFSSYRATADVTVNDGTPIHLSVVTGEDLGTETRLIGEAANKAEYENDVTATPPMGIIMNNLPYIGLIALALLGLSAYVAVRSRRRVYDVYSER